jgi:hypothetical protein
MQRLEVSGVVRPLSWPLGVKGFSVSDCNNVLSSALKLLLFITVLQVNKPHVS